MPSRAWGARASNRSWRTGTPAPAPAAARRRPAPSAITTHSCASWAPSFYGLSTQDTAYQRESSRASAPALRAALRRRRAAHPRDETADLRGRRADPAQAPHTGHPRGGGRARLLPRLSADGHAEQVASWRRSAHTEALEPLASSSITSRSATSARGGPFCTKRTITSTASASPSNTASTAPSSRLVTQPATPSFCARSRVASRKNTPWTRPRTTTRQRWTSAIPDLWRGQSSLRDWAAGELLGQRVQVTADRRRHRVEHVARGVESLLVAPVSCCLTRWTSPIAPSARSTVSVRAPASSSSPPPRAMSTRGAGQRVGDLEREPGAVLGVIDGDQLVAVHLAQGGVRAGSSSSPGAPRARRSPRRAPPSPGRAGAGPRGARPRVLGLEDHAPPGRPAAALDGDHDVAGLARRTLEVADGVGVVALGRGNRVERLDTASS